MENRDAPSSKRPSLERMPPYSEEAERGVLGSILLDAERVVDLAVERQLSPESFYLSSHQVLFETLVDMHQARKPIDLLTVGDRLRQTRQEAAVGGEAYLESLVDMAYCYPEVHKQATPEQVLSYFRQYAWSRPVYATVLEKLAYRSYIKKKWAMAAPIYRELAMIRQDPQKLLEYARYLFDCVQAQGTYQYAEKDVAIIVRALEHHATSAHMPDAQKEKLVNDYELYARDIITHLHANARQSNKTFHVAWNPPTVLPDDDLATCADVVRSAVIEPRRPDQLL